MAFDTSLARKHMEEYQRRLDQLPKEHLPHDLTSALDAMGNAVECILSELDGADTAEFERRERSNPNPE